MFGPSSPWSLCSGAPSSVTQWLLYRTVLITVLFAVASSSDWCNHLQSDFTGHVQTIGPLDGRLWAITTEWTVHEMTPCDKGNETLSLCIEIGFPVRVDAKWPELAKSVKEKANVTDFNFTVDNSAFMSSTDNDRVLVMHGASFKPFGYFGFNFSANSSKGIDGSGDIFKSLWISSDGKNKTYRLVDSGKGLKQITGSVADPVWYIIDAPHTPVEYICNVTSDGKLSLNITTEDCLSNMNWTVKKAVRYDDQFYFFAQDQVYIFAAVENVTTRVHTVHYDSFIHCKMPTTTSPPTSPPSNVTKSAITTVSEHNLTTSASTTKGSNKTMIIVIVIVAVLAIIGIILAFVFYKKPSKSSQNTTAQPIGKANNKVSPKKAGPSKMAGSQIGSSMSSAADSKAGKKPQSQVSAPKGSSVISGQGKHSKSQAK